jgi:hypothetical protein
MEIPCSFESVPLWYGIFSNDDTKMGRYTAGALNVKGLGYDKWALVANIILKKPIQEYIDDGMSEDEIMAACLNFLNKPPTKRARKLKYGQLECRYFNVLENKISASLTTTERNSKYFWGRGAKLQEPRKMSKRARPRKSK